MSLRYFAFDILRSIFCIRYFVRRYFAYSIFCHSIFCDTIFCDFDILRIRYLAFRHFATSIFCGFDILRFRYFAFDILRSIFCDSIFCFSIFCPEPCSNTPPPPSRWWKIQRPSRARVNGWLRISVVMMQRCYNAVFRYIFLSMTFLTCWQIFPDYAAPPCTLRYI